MGFHHRLGNYHQQSPYPNYHPGANYRNFALAGLALIAVIKPALLARIGATARAELAVERVAELAGQNFALLAQLRLAPLARGAPLAFVAVVVAIAEFAELACFLITQTKLNAPRHILRP